MNKRVMTPEKVSEQKEVAAFFGKLGALLSGGVRFADALDTFAHTPLPGEYKDLPQKFAAQLRAGRSFTDLLEENSHLFSQHVIEMTRSGEEQGILDIIFVHISAMLKGEADYRGGEDVDMGYEPDETTTSSQSNAENAVPNETDPSPGLNKLLNYLEQAQKERASDLHFESTKEGAKIRMRIDGILVEKAKILSEELVELLAASKIACGCDPCERRLPQDGTARLTIGTVENQLMRVSFLPCLYGESCTIRILTVLSDKDMKSLDELIGNKKVLERVKAAAAGTRGLFIVSGPTGSGKTTTYYSLLKERNEEDEKIISVEDPVEYSLEGISQIRVNYKFGLTFPTALRSSLRNDPDVIAAGEVRNVETAEILMQAALSGHMVFTSLHGAHAISSLLRLMNIGIEPSHIGDCLQGILAQQLVRRLCPSCRTKDSENYGKQYEGLTLYKAQGCEECHNGYKGRMAIHEFLPMTPGLVKAVMSRLDHNELLEAAHKDGFRSFWDNAKELLKDGLTSMEELKRMLPTPQ